MENSSLIGLVHLDTLVEVQLSRDQQKAIFLSLTTISQRKIFKNRINHHFELFSKAKNIRKRERKKIEYNFFDTKSQREEEKDPRHEETKSDFERKREKDSKSAIIFRETISLDQEQSSQTIFFAVTVFYF